MDQTHSATPKTCEYCKRLLHGRSDQRFCNDTCRNTFNRYKREYEKVSIPDGAVEIIKVIKRNYEILKRDIPGQIVDRYGNIQCDTNVVLQGGLNLKFYTSSYSSGSEKWYCVFDRCYSVQGDNFFITDSRDQLNLET